MGLDDKYSPTSRGYRESLTFPGGGSLYAALDNPAVIKGQVNDSVFDSVIWKLLKYGVSHNNGELFEPDEYMTNYLSRETARLVHTHKGSPTSTAPWFITLAYNAVHDPMQALVSDYDSPEVIRATRRYTRDTYGEGGSGDPSEILLFRVHAAMILALDRGVGQVLQALRDTDQYDNTLILFTSDNGGAANGVKHVNKPFRGWKATFYEGGLRVPLYMKLPLALTATPMPPAEFTQRVLHLDIFKTILAVVEGIGIGTGSDTGIGSASTNTPANDSYRSYTQSQSLSPPLEYTIGNGINLIPHILDMYNNNIDHLDLNHTNTNTNTDITINANQRNVSMIPNPSAIPALTLPLALPLLIRPLYWKSGHYQTLIYRSYKLHLSSLEKLSVSNRIWLYNLDTDATEQKNILDSLPSLYTYTAFITLYNTTRDTDTFHNSNISLNQTAHSIDLLLNTMTHKEHNNDIFITKLVLHLYSMMEQFQHSIPIPLWCSYVTVPIAIDKLKGTDCDDELIYWTL